VNGDQVVVVIAPTAVVIAALGILGAWLRSRRRR